MTRQASVLVFTPTPTHPPIQGNRRRALDICRALQSMGADLTVLYYATEGIRPSEARQMRETWGELELVAPDGFVRRQTLARYPAIDDWYDDAITEAVQGLCAKRQFDICLVNYVWYSKLFDALPSHVVRVIDTHDVFGGRGERFAEVGLAPEWFHTSVQEESKGLDRGDFVIAIQDGEAAQLQARTDARVRTVGFLSAPDFLQRPRNPIRRRLRAGYIGSGNPFNVASVLSFARAVESVPQIVDAVEFHFAGQICACLAKTSHPFLLHGNMGSAREFYESIDVAINPMTGGTGLKIKSLEALSFGKPLAATKDAMSGIDSSHPGHQLDRPQDVADWLMGLAGHRPRLEDEATISRAVFRAYRQAQLQAFRDLWSEICEQARLRRPHDNRARAGVPL